MVIMSSFGLCNNLMKRFPPTRSEHLLHQISTAHYNFLLESIKDHAIFMLDPEGFIATWNAGAENIKGYTREEAVNQHFSIFYTQEDQERNYPAEILESVKRNGKFEEQGWRVRKDGSRFWASVTIFAVYADDKKLIGFSKVTRDLSERKNLEDHLNIINKELRESEERARLLISGVKDYAIFLVSPEGNIASWNNGAKEIKGYEADEVLGRPISIFYLPEAIDGNYPKYELRKALEEGRFEDEGWRVRKDGSQFWANVLITPIFNEQNQHIGFTKITRDLSERIKNEELMQKNQELYRVNQDLDIFVYAASHDLKAPISNIEGLLTVLLESLSPETLANEHSQRIIGMMQYSINRFKLTISNLTDVVKLQKEHSLPPTTVNLADITKEVLLDMKQIIESSNVDIRTVIDCEISVHYSRKNLRSIIYNLVSNGIKYRSPERPPFVEIRCSEKEDYIVLKVEDNGLGMDAKNKNNIFKMFHRLHDHVDGTGIGLFMVKRIIENAGGTIEVKSNLGEGSVFTVPLRK